MVTEVIKTIKPGGGGDYTNLTDWENARRGNIVTRDTIEIAECYGGDCANASTISLLAANWTVDSTHYIVIRAASSAKHAGTFDAGKATIGAGAGGGISSQVGQLYIRDMQFYLGAAITHINAANTANAVVAERCLMRGGGVYLLHNSGGSGTGELIARSCIGYGNSAGQRGGQTTGANSKLTIHGCTLIASDDALFIGNAVSTIIEDGNYLKCGAAKVIYYNPFSGTWSKGATTATSNAEAITAGLRNIAYDTTTFTNVTGGTENLLLPVGSPLRGVGALIAGCTFDILNEARVASFVDVGAHNPTQKPSGGPVLFILGF